MTTMAHDPSAFEQREHSQPELDDLGAMRLSSDATRKPSSASDMDVMSAGGKQHRSSSSSSSQDPPAPFLRVRSIEEVAAKKKVLLHDVDAGARCLSCSSCPGFQLHVWRKICSHCRCPWQNHDIFDDEEVDAETGVILNEDGQSTRQAALQSLSTHFKQMSHTQNPVQDKEPHMCATICDEDTLAKFSRLKTRRMKHRRDSILFAPHTHNLSGPCDCCQNSIRPSDTATIAEGEENTTHQFHLDCFTCQGCAKPIVGPDFYAYRPRSSRSSTSSSSSSSTELRLCARCHAEKFLPRCAGCDELIFDPYFTQAEHRNWHQPHFCCHLCDVFLGGKEYTKTDADDPVCIECYNTKLAPPCHTCGQPILTDDMLLEIGERCFHGSDACFLCTTCKRPLYTEEGGGNGVLINDALYCRPHAREATEALTVRCFVCKQQIKESHVTVKERPVHTRCFKCNHCGCRFADSNSLPVRSAHLLGDRLLCHEHATSLLENDIEV